MSKSLKEHAHVRLGYIFGSPTQVFCNCCAEDKVEDSEIISMVVAITESDTHCAKCDTLMPNVSVENKAEDDYDEDEDEEFLSDPEVISFDQQIKNMFGIK
jgi:hypothetical protein